MTVLSRVGHGSVTRAEAGPGARSGHACPWEGAGVPRNAAAGDEGASLRTDSVSANGNGWSGAQRKRCAGCYGLRLERAAGGVGPCPAVPGGTQGYPAAASKEHPEDTLSGAREGGYGGTAITPG